MSVIMMKTGVVSMLFILLLTPSMGWSADKCDSVRSELENISAKISEAVKPCEGKGGEFSCSAEEAKEISARVGELFKRGNELCEQCLGISFSEYAGDVSLPGGGGEQ